MVVTDRSHSVMIQIVVLSAVRYELSTRCWRSGSPSCAIAPSLRQRSSRSMSPQAPDWCSSRKCDASWPASESGWPAPGVATTLPKRNFLLPCVLLSERAARTAQVRKHLVRAEFALAQRTGLVIWSHEVAKARKHKDYADSPLESRAAI